MALWPSPRVDSESESTSEQLLSIKFHRQAPSSVSTRLQILTISVTWLLHQVGFELTAQERQERLTERLGHAQLDSEA